MAFSMGVGAGGPVTADYLNALTGKNQAAASASMARDQFGLAKRQFESNQSLRDALLGYLGITGQNPGSPMQPGGPAQSGGGLFREWLGRQDANRAEYSGLLDGFGESFRTDINDRYTTSLNNALGSLESRGLGSSSLAGVASAANERNRGREMLALEDQLVGKKLDTLQGVDARADSAFGAQFDQTNSLVSALLGSIR